jgi:hypothetical protein
VTVTAGPTQRARAHSGGVRRDTPRWRAGRRGQLLLVTVVFGLSRLAFAAAGVRFDMSPLRGGWIADPWQLLDSSLLHHHLVVSLWHLNSQPPLFNLFCGVLLKLPYGIQEPVAALTFLLLGLAMALALFATMVELRVPTWPALVVTVVVVVDPAYVLYENWLNYAYPTAALLTVSAWCLVRYLRSQQPRFGVAFFAGVAAVVLLNSTYQLVWVVAALAVVLLAKVRWRSVLVAAAVPLVLVVGWVAKDTVQVGTVTTSTWLGMNLTRTTLDTASPAQIRDMVDHHLLTPIAEVAAFSAVSAYVPRFVAASGSGVAAVGAPSKADKDANFNNGIYAQVSSLYLHDDLAFIRARPQQYADAVANAAEQWTVPSDEYYFVSKNRAHISSWANLFDRTVLVRPVADPGPGILNLAPHQGPGAAQLSYLTMVIDALAVFGAPWVVWRLRRVDRATAATMAFLWMTSVYALAATSLLEFGENQRFRMELGPVPLAAAVVVVTLLVRRRPDAWEDRSAAPLPT